MTPSFRFISSLALSVIALLAGWIVASPTYGVESLSGGAGAVQIAQTSDADIESHVAAIARSGLFPEARTVTTTERGPASPETAEALEDALRDPSLSALVKRGQQWHIHLYAGYEGRNVREAGDQLSGGWVIETIEPASVLLSRGGETRRIEVFRVEPATQ